MSCVLCVLQQRGVQMEHETHKTHTRTNTAGPVTPSPVLFQYIYRASCIVLYYNQQTHSQYHNTLYLYSSHCHMFRQYCVVTRQSHICCLLSYTSSCTAAVEFRKINISKVLKYYAVCTVKYNKIHFTLQSVVQSVCVFVAACTVCCRCCYFVCSLPC